MKKISIIVLIMIMFYIVANMVWLKVVNNNIDELNIKIKNKLLAGLLALFLGGMGIHRFYLGYIKIGIVQLSLWVLGYFTGGITWVIVQIWALIESILIFLGKIKDSEGNDLE